METRSGDHSDIIEFGKAVKEALAVCRFGIVGAILISMVMNVLVLTGPFYMLQIYDRVLPGHSISTLDRIQHFSPYSLRHARLFGPHQNATDGASWRRPRSQARRRSIQSAHSSSMGRSQAAARLCGI